MAPSEILPWAALRWGRPRDPAGNRKGVARSDEMFQAALKKYSRLLVWDLEGIRGGDPQLEVYRRFEGKGLWVDGGARNVGTLVDVLVAGADVAVINGRRMGGHEVIAEASRLTGQLAFCLEEGPGLRPVQEDGRKTPSALFREAQSAGVERGLYLHHPILHEVPAWVADVEGLELYAGPVPVSAGEPQAEGRVVANLFELI
ncbi:MAG: hypothetical protein ACE5EW_06060 [Thermoplasmata archaeon]